MSASKRQRKERIETAGGEDARNAEVVHAEAHGHAYPYPTSYADHFETSLSALRDIEPALYRLAVHLGKKKNELRIYDPYFCTGKVKEHWKELQFTNIIHEKRDFYKDIEEGSVPDFDVLVSNPPYSEDHKEKILNYCMQSNKPWLLLLPNYVANKLYYCQFVASLVSKHKGADVGHVSSPFYLVPRVKYEYCHPDGTGKESSPFFSMWYIYLGQEVNGKVYHWWERKLMSSKDAQDVKLMKSTKELTEQEAVPHWKRANPRQRKKAMAQKRERQED